MFYNLKINLRNLRRGGIYSAINSVVDICRGRIYEFVYCVADSRFPSIQGSNEQSGKFNQK